MTKLTVKRDEIKAELTRLMNKGLELEDAVNRTKEDATKNGWSEALIERVAETLETPKLDPARILNRTELIAVFALAGYTPREADLAVCERLGATVANVADYCWDHLMGEPRTPSLAKVQRTIQAVVDRLPKPEPPTVPEVWTFAVVDRDLIRDDSSSAATVLPAHFWPSREAARAALEADLRQRFTDYVEDVEGASFTPPVLQDNPFDPGGLYGSVDWLEDTELYIYRITEAPSDEALHPDQDEDPNAPTTATRGSILGMPIK